MEPNKILPDDPRLTAYALNEMEPAERGEFEKALQHDAAARQTVEEIRATVAALETALEHEPVELAPKAAPRRALFGKIVRFPQIYYMVSGLAAACFALVFIYSGRNEVPKVRKHYIEVPLTAVETKSEAEPAKDLQVDLTKPAEADGLLQQAKKKFAVDVPMPAPIAVPTGSSPAVAASAPLARSMEKTDAAVVLSPFEVTGAANRGYTAKATLAGSRVRTPLSEVTYGSVRTELEHNTEAYSARRDNDYLRVTDQPLSTFSVDVDTASYANVRRFLTQGQLPPPDAVRIEEMVNYFPYNYQAPTGNVPFAASLEVAAAPWAPEHRLVRIGLKGREVSEASRPAVNLVFLLDVSGSMNEANKLPLVKQSLRMLVNKLRPDDRVAITVYAGASGMALPSTSAAHKAEILDAIDRLQAEGSTNGAMGIHLAYDIAKANFITGGVNRVILATDGDFNVGVTSEGGLVRLVEEKAKSGVFLSVLGFGMGNLKDSQLEQLADKGNGNYAYIDSLAEARKSLVEQAGGTLVTIAKDVKIQVEFNPLEVQAYRLIGYENRLLAKEDFNNDKVDAGEIGAGHTVTALYEIVPTGAAMPESAGTVDALKYQRPVGPALLNHTEMLTVKIRYKEPTGEVSSKLEFVLRDAGAAFQDASQDFKFAAAVAAFGMTLRDSPHKGTMTLSEVAAWGRAGISQDAGGYRNEFVGLVERAHQLTVQ